VPVTVLAAAAPLALAQQGKETTAALLAPRLKALVVAAALVLWAHQQQLVLARQAA
jgi:hypothetical protein